MKTSTLAYLLTGLSLAVLPACGPPDDPSTEDNKKDNNGTAMMDMGGGGTDSGETSKDMDEQPKEDMDTATDGGEDTPDGGTGTDTGTQLSECEQRALYEGQMGNPNPKKGGGGAFVLGTASYEADSGLIKVNEAVKAALDAGTIKADEDRNDDLQEDELVFAEGEEIDITGAIVTSTSFERDDGANFTLATRLTFQDQKVGVLAFIDGITMDKDGNPIVVKVGDKLNFKVKAVKGFGGDTPQISQVTSVEKVGSGEDVGVMEKTGQDLVIEDYQKLIRIHGDVASAGSSCGGDSQCFDISHDGKTTTLRISEKVSRLPMVGDCITYVGPVGSFPGPLADGNVTMQMDAVNFTWYRGPFAE